MSDYLLRFAGIGRLYGTKALEAFQQAHVCVVGIGGVGSWAAEALARSGIGKITLIDLDDICISNTNRQLHALTDSIGQDKVAVMAERIKAINPDCKVHQVEDFVTQDNLFELMSKDFDYVVDCIDTLSAKTFLIKGCIDRNLPIVSSMGAGGKVDPSQIKVTDISKTYICNLAKYVRKRLQSMGIKKGLKVVFSPEKADQDKIIVTEKAFPKKSIIGTLSYMPAIFGCTVASVVIRDLMVKD